LNGTITSYKSDFTIKWQLKLEGNLANSPVIAGGRLIAASTLGEIFIIDSETKAEIQSIGTNYEIVSPLIVTEYNGNKELIIPKTSSSKDAIIFSDASGSIYCYDLETLQELWANSDSKSPVIRNMIVTGNKLVFKNCDGKIICIDIRTGLLNWRWGYKDMFADNQTGLFFNGKQIVTITNNNMLNGIDILLGVSEWQTEETGIKDFSGLPDNTDTIIALTDKDLTLYDSKKGKEIRKIKIKEKNITAFLKPDNISNRQFLISSDNILFQLDKSKSLQKIGFIGNISIVSFIDDLKNNLYLLTIDGQLLNITLK
jgi:outer membrane protein assembly factor BamB